MQESWSKTRSKHFCNNDSKGKRIFHFTIDFSIFFEYNTDSTPREDLEALGQSFKLRPLRANWAEDGGASYSMRPRGPGTNCPLCFPPLNGSAHTSAAMICNGEGTFSNYPATFIILMVINPKAANHTKYTHMVKIIDEWPFTEKKIHVSTGQGLKQ